jgi:hypothetical protein
VIIRGNYIGTNVSGTAAIGNGLAAAGTWGGSYRWEQQHAGGLMQGRKPNFGNFSRVSRSTVPATTCSGTELGQMRVELLASATLAMA